MIMRALFALHSLAFVGLAGHTTRVLSANGDTAQILGQVFVSALVLAGVIYFKNRAFAPAD